VDGYIKNKTEAIKSVRKSILGKYSLTFLIIILIPFWLLALAGNQPPKKWTQAEIVFSHISLEQIGLQRGRSYVLNTQDGKQFVIKSKLVDMDDLSEYLTSGNTYHLVFSSTAAGENHIEALSDDHMIIQNLENSITQWKMEQQGSIIAIIVTAIVEVIALILIDSLWCKQEHSQIRKLKADIKRRKDYIANKQTP